MANGALSGPLRYGVIAIAAATLGLAGGWGASQLGLTRGSTEQVVHDYLLEKPEIITEAMDRLQAREAAARLEPMQDLVLAPFPGAVLGNPKGSVTLVEFHDFACGFCRQSIAEVEALIAENPDLKVVVREFPILSQQSVEAARMALAAAEQGRYPAFYKAMFAAGRPSPETIEAAARQAGLDMERARKVAASPAVEAEIAHNRAIAKQLGFGGTPSWVAGGQAFSGAVPREVLAEALAQDQGA